MTSTLHLSTQMCSILTNFNQHGYVFFDMKNSNWLINAEGNIQLDDLKSIRFANTEGQYVFDNPKNEWCPAYATTPWMNPPELMTLSAKKPFAVDKMQSYMLGITLYQNLTNCDYVCFDNRQKGIPFDFSHDIFQSEEGQDLAILIDSMTDLDPEIRPPLHEAQRTLNDIQSRFITTRVRVICPEILDEIASYRQNDRNPELNEFIDHYAVQINTALATKNLTALNAIENTLMSKLQALDFGLNLKKRALFELVDEIETYKFGETDQKIGELITDYQEKICLAEKNKDIITLDYLNVELLALVDRLQKDPCQSKLRSYIDALRNKSDASAHEKANQIESAIGLVPIDIRGLLGGDVRYAPASSQELVRNVQLEMAQRRGIIYPDKKETLLTKIQDVDEINLEKATESYRHFRFELADLRAGQKTTTITEEEKSSIEYGSGAH